MALGFFWSVPKPASSTKGTLPTSWPGRNDMSTIGSDRVAALVMVAVRSFVR
jgi:hypothetical protein